MSRGSALLIVMADTAVSAIAGGRIRELPSKRFNRTRLHHAHVPVRSLVAPPPSPAGEPSYSWAFCTVTALTVLVMAWYVRVLRRSSAARFTVLAKRGCLLVAVIQNSFGVMWFRYSRITPECRDDPAAVVVLYGEILKLGACLFLLMLRGPKGLHTELREKIWDRPLDTLKLSIPSGCYAIGNNLQFMAAQNLSAVMIHVLERSKVLCTACLGVIILKKALRPTQWLALVLLVVGVILSQNYTEARVDGTQPSIMLGSVAALMVSLVSSFSGVYLELVIKSDQTSLALRNVQLAIFSIPLQLITIGYLGQPMLVAMCWKTWVLAINLAFAGLLVAAIMRFADNNLKNLAQALATILSALVSMPLFGFQPTVLFIIGTSLVISSVFLYVYVPKGRAWGASVAVLGGGGHCRMVISALRAAHGPFAVDAVYDDDQTKEGTMIMGVPIMHTTHLTPGSRAVIAIGSNSARERCHKRFPGLQWITVVHPFAWVDPSVVLGDGTVVFAGAIIQPGTTIGKHTLVNTNCSIDNDCHVGDFVSVCSRAALCTGVRAGNSSFLGAGCTIRSHVSIAANCTVGIGAALLSSIETEGETWVGVPARPMRSRTGPARVAVHQPSEAELLADGQTRP
jgi:UDP-sugar transporter A1/2/3